MFLGLRLSPDLGATGVDAGYGGRSSGVRCQHREEESQKQVDLCFCENLRGAGQVLLDAPCKSTEVI